MRQVRDASTIFRVLIRLSHVGNTIDYQVLSAISSLLSIIGIMQPHESPSQSLPDVETQNQQPEDLIRQGYTIRASGGQTFVELNALQGVNLPLAKVLKPDFSKGMKMAAGVRVCFSWNITVISLVQIFFPSSTLCQILIPTPTWKYL